MKRNYQMEDSEPTQMKFLLPSEGEHLFTVSNILEDIDSDPNVIHVKCEVTGGDEEGRTILQRLNLDETANSFFAVRLFLKAINMAHKGKVEIETDDFQGKQFYAIVVHRKSKKNNDIFANIGEYNFDKIVEQPIGQASVLIKEETLNWEE